MDENWAADVLEQWIEQATTALGTGLAVPIGVRLDPLREREEQTRAVIARVMDINSPKLIEQTANPRQFLVSAGLELAKSALGKLRSQTETLEHLGSRAPAMSADALHPIVWNAASALWADGHFGQSVQRAATFLNANVQDLTGRHDVSDAGLMQQAFSLADPEPGKPRLRWRGDDGDLTVRAMRGGILNFSQGVFMAIRNPATHSTEDLPQQHALEQLAVLSTLARWIEGCELVQS
jgi:hypothetical protein